jgi:hypothetical protein
MLYFCTYYLSGNYSKKYLTLLVLFKNTNSILELYIILINLYYNDVIYISLVSKFIEISIGVIAMLVGIALIGGLI